MKISKLCALALLLAAFCTPNVYAQDVGDDPFDDGGAAMEESAPMDGGEGEDAFAEPPAEEEPQPVAKPEPAKAKPAAKKKEMKKAKKEAKKKKVAKKAKGKKAGKKKKEKKGHLTPFEALGPTIRVKFKVKTGYGTQPV